MALMILIGASLLLSLIALIPKCRDFPLVSVAVFLLGIAVLIMRFGT